MTERDRALILEEPDRGFRVSHVEVEASGGPEAIAAMWKRLRPSFDRAVEETDRSPATDGWDEFFQYDYEVAAAEAAMIEAYARRKGNVWAAAVEATIVDVAPASSMGF